jgi:hypothetical protein
MLQNLNRRRYFSREHVATCRVSAVWQGTRVQMRLPSYGVPRLCRRVTARCCAGLRSAVQFLLSHRKTIVRPAMVAFFSASAVAPAMSACRRVGPVPSCVALVSQRSRTGSQCWPCGYAAESARYFQVPVRRRHAEARAPDRRRWVSPAEGLPPAHPGRADCSHAGRACGAWCSLERRKAVDHSLVASHPQLLELSATLPVATGPTRRRRPCAGTTAAHGCERRRWRSGI